MNNSTNSKKRTPKSVINFPPEMTQLDQWLIWGPGKVPLNPYTQEKQYGSWWDDPSTQVPFKALRLVKQKGFALRRDGDITCIDLDDCLTAKGKLIKNLKPGAKWILEHLPKTYIEVSVRGRGLHIVLRGTLPQTLVRKKDEGFEAYSKERFIAMTGLAYNGSTLKLAKGQVLLNKLWDQYGSSPKEDPIEKPKWLGATIWLDVENYLQHYGLTYKLSHLKEYDEYQFDDCPMCQTHTIQDGRHFLRQYPSGKMAFQCHHSQCEEVGWGQFKERYIATGFWMRKTEEGKTVPLAPSDPTPANYLNALHAMGYKFSINEMNDRPYVNNILMSKPLESYLISELRNTGYKKKDWFIDAAIGEGFQNQFHPIRDYFNGLTWDGEDHITKFGEYILDEDGLFTPLLQKWLVAAVERIFQPSTECQPPVFVWVGEQDAGKSVLSDFIGSGLPQYTVHKDVQPDNKDYEILAISKFVWEVKELETTISRAEIGRLKAFFDASQHTVRAPYGSYDITKDTTACFIGTINDHGNGFLNDPTGNRRYWICRIVSINFNYKKEVDINQVWAQAVALFNGGERYHLDAETKKKVNIVKELYEYEDPLEPYIRRICEYTGKKRDFLPTSEVHLELVNLNLCKSVSDRSEQQRIAAVLTKMHGKRGQSRVNGQQLRGWFGLKMRTHDLTSANELDMRKLTKEKAKKELEN